VICNKQAGKVDGYHENAKGGSFMDRVPQVLNNMKHALQVLNYEKRKLINRLYEMQEDNDFGRAAHTDQEFQAIKSKISQVDRAIKLIEASVSKQAPTPPQARVVYEGFAKVPERKEG
jgi:hypothetical protein